MRWSGRTGTSAATTSTPERILSERLGPTDLAALLLAVYARRSAARRPAAVLADYERSRFFGAVSFPPSAYAAFDTVAAEAMGGRFKTLLLSPMALLVRRQRRAGLAKA